MDACKPLCEDNVVSRSLRAESCRPADSQWRAAGKPQPRYQVSKVGKLNDGGGGGKEEDHQQSRRQEETGSRIIVLKVNFPPSYKVYPYFTNVFR